MIEFKKFIEKQQISENSLYKNQAEKDALIKNRTKLLDAFYLNFFAFLGMFSINQLAPLKKYEETEGKLIVNNIGDKNHDVSLAIKLLHDENLIQRSAVDKMTRLLAKIKMKQIKPSELDENLVRSMLNDMQYTSRRGSAQVMRVIDDFADNKIQLKHVAYQLYTIAKKKEYKDITSELRAIGVYYSGWFRKVAADQTPSASPVAQPAVAHTAVSPTALAKNIQQQAAPEEVQTIVKADKKAEKKAAPLPKGKVPEFWNALYNARGKIEFNRVFKEYGITDGVQLQEYLANASTASMAGDVNMDDLKKTYPYLTYKTVSTIEYYPVFRKLIDNAKSIVDIVHPIAQIQDAYSKETIQSTLHRSPFINEGPLYEKIIQLTKNYVDSIKASTFSIDANVKSSLSNLLQGVLRRKTPRNIFNVEQNAKLYWLFQGNVVSGSEVKYVLNEMIPSVTINAWGNTYIDRKEWESKIDENVRNVLSDFALLDKLGIIISDVGDFDEKIKSVVDDASLGEFIGKVVAPLLSLSSDDKLDNEKSKKLVDQVLNNFNNFNELEYVFERLNARVRVITEPGKPTWTETFWKKYYDKAFEDVNAGKDTMSTFAHKMRIVEINSILPTDHREKMSQFESRFIDMVAETFVDRKDIDYGVSQLITNSASNDFLNKLMPKIISAFDSFSYSSFSYTPRNQVISKQSSDLVFNALEKSNWDHTKLHYLVQALTNKEEFGKWLAEFISTKEVPTSQKQEMTKWMLRMFQDYEPSQSDLESTFNLREVVNSLSSYKNNTSMMEFLNKKFLEEAEKQDSSVNMQNIITDIIRHDENLLRSIVNEEATDSQIAGLLTKTMGLLDAGTKTRFDRNKWQYINKETYGFDLKCATITFQAMGSRVFEIEGGEQAVERLAEILKLPSRIQKEFRESVITDIATLFTNAEVNNDTERAFSKFEKKTQKMLAANFAIAQFAGGAVDEINKNAIVKPRSILPAKGALKVLRLNQVSIPSGDVLDLRTKRGQDITLQSVKDAAIRASKSFRLEEQAISEVKSSEEELEKLSVVYNRYNRYKHGGIAVRIRKVFNVSIPSQQIGWKQFLDESAQAIENGTYYHKYPQFHGTASLPASMILRYGFSVIDEKLAREAGIKYAGRMLGDGIYSSNVLDKVSQYINDDAPTGVSRRRGVVGYIFEMETQGSSWGRTCNAPGADFATGGTGEFNNERSGLVSPEWAWKYANRQCKIKRCFEIELINKNEMDELVNKHKDVMEAIGYSSFKDYLLSEAKASRLNQVKNYAAFTFMDNIVPIGNGKYVDLNEEPESALKLPAGASIDHGMYGVTILFKNNENVNIRLVYGSDIESNYSARSLYEKLLGKKV